MRIKKEFKDLAIGDIFSIYSKETIKEGIYEKTNSAYNIENIKIVSSGRKCVWTDSPTAQRVYHIIPDIVDLI